MHNEFDVDNDYLSHGIQSRGSIMKFPAKDNYELCIMHYAL